MPKGLLGQISSVALCPEDRAVAGTCDSASKIGTTALKIGAGELPYALPGPGKAPTAVYLAGPYKGAPVSLSIAVPAQAGPFDLGTVVVRAGLYVDPITAQVTAKSDPLPTILDGVRTTLAGVDVNLDRPGFMLNPTGCDAKSIDGTITPVSGGIGAPVVDAGGLGLPTSFGNPVAVSSRFQAASCQELDLKPTLYLNDHGVTTEVAAASSSFVTATSDGHLAVYLKDGHVYRYNADTATSELLSGVGGVQAVLGVSDDLSSVYFSADGDVIPGESPTDFSQAIYRWHNGSLTHVATLSNDRDDPNTGPGSAVYTSIPNLSAWISQGFMAWTPDGKDLVFDTSAQVTGYDAGGFREVYRYDADADAVSCLSCPDGEATADAVLNSRLQLLGLYARPLGPTRNITTDGRRVFFESGDPLVPGDTNGKSDVYVWESGQLHLISDGKSGSDARFVAASAHGGDVFLATAAPLVSADTDSLVDIYDARIGGGVADAATPVPPCSGDGCQGPTGSPPPPPSAGTVSFAGAGNLADRSSSAGLLPGKLSAKTPRTVRGSAAMLQVRVPGKGRIRASGSGLRVAQKAATKAGTYTVRVQLSQLAKHTLNRKHRVQVQVTVKFIPEKGRAQQVRVPVTFTRARTVDAASRRSARRATVLHSDTRKGR